MIYGCSVYDEICFENKEPCGRGKKKKNFFLKLYIYDLTRIQIKIIALYLSKFLKQVNFKVKY